MKKENITKGKFIVIDDFDTGDSIIIKRDGHRIVFEAGEMKEEISIKYIRTGETIDGPGLDLPYRLLASGLHNYHWEFEYRSIRPNDPKKGFTVTDWILRNNEE